LRQISVEAPREEGWEETPHSSPEEHQQKPLSLQVIICGKTLSFRLIACVSKQIGIEIT